MESLCMINIHAWQLASEVRSKWSPFLMVLFSLWGRRLWPQNSNWGRRRWESKRFHGILNMEACNRVKASQWSTRHGRMLGSQNDTKMSTEDPVWTGNSGFVMPLILKFLQFFFFFTPSRFTQHSLYNSWEFRQFEFSRIVIFANWVQWKNKESTNRCICEKSFIEIKEKKAVIREE